MLTEENRGCPRSRAFRDLGFHGRVNLGISFDGGTESPVIFHDADRFALAMGQVSGKRLTYSELRQRPIAAPRNDRSGGNASPFLVLVGILGPARSRSLRLFLGL